MPSSPFGHPHALSGCYATWYIRRKAAELAGKYGFAADEMNDISQELSLHLLRHWSSFDESKSKASTFITSSVDGKVCEMIRNQKREKRDSLRECPLSQDVNAFESGLLDGVRGQPLLNEQDIVELQVDCEVVLKRLPTDLREIAVLLKDNCPEAIARQLGMSRTTMHRRIAEIREYFVAVGYGDD